VQRPLPLVLPDQVWHDQVLPDMVLPDENISGVVSIATRIMGGLMLFRMRLVREDLGIRVLPAGALACIGNCKARQCLPFFPVLWLLKILQGLVFRLD